MNGANYEFYRIELFDVWEFEKRLFESGKKPFSEFQQLKENYEQLIIDTKNWQSKSEKYLKTISCFTSIFHYDNGSNSDKSYFLRYKEEYGKAIESNETLKLDYFVCQDSFYSHIQTIYPHPSLENFELWFALKLRQYKAGLKFLNQFLEYNLIHLFRGDFEKYNDTLEIVIAQYADSYFSPKLTELIERWIEKSKGMVFPVLSNEVFESWPYETFTDDSFFQDWGDDIESVKTKNQEKKVSKANKGKEPIELQAYLDHDTFFDVKFNKLKAVGDSDFLFFMQELVKELINENLISGETKTPKFINLFTKSKLTPSEKIYWTASASLLRDFIKQLADDGQIGQRLTGLDKYYVAEKCFIVKFKGMKEVGPIPSYRSLRNAAKSPTKSSEKLVRITDKLKQFHAKLESK